MEKIKIAPPISFSSDGIGAIRVDHVPLFDVSKIFDCGQCFRFDPVFDTRHQAEYAGCAFGKYISVAQDGDTVYIYNTTVEEYDGIWKRFLSLDTDYGEINHRLLSLSDRQVLFDAVDASSGIRILRQDGWEALCSFILSQNNNIPRIKGLVAALCKRCGSPVDLSGMEKHIASAHRDRDGNFYSFPTPEGLTALGISGLYDLKTGFRAKYLYDAAKQIISGEVSLSFIKGADTADAMEHLMRIKGVGPKVASCVLLFGFEKLDAFPVDVWIKKALAKYFDSDFSPEALGEFAGVAQQYLFYYERYLQK
jgi:N-glycosylase/DNA lyase